MVDVIESARCENPVQVNRLHMRERSITAYLAAARLQSSSIIICHGVADLTPDIPAIMNEQTRPRSSSCDLFNGMLPKWSDAGALRGRPTRPGHKSSLDREEPYISRPAGFVFFLPSSRARVPLCFHSARRRRPIDLPIYLKSNFLFFLKRVLQFSCSGGKIGTAGHMLLCEIVSLLALQWFQSLVASRPKAQVFEASASKKSISALKTSFSNDLDLSTVQLDYAKPFRNVFNTR